MAMIFTADMGHDQFFSPSSLIHHIHVIVCSWCCSTLQKKKKYMICFGSTIKRPTRVSSDDLSLKMRTASCPGFLDWWSFSQLRRGSEECWSRGKTRAPSQKLILVRHSHFFKLSAHSHSPKRWLTHKNVGSLTKIPRQVYYKFLSNMFSTVKRVVFLARRFADPSSKVVDLTMIFKKDLVLWVPSYLIKNASIHFCFEIHLRR